MSGFELAVCLLLSHPQAELHVELHVAAVDSACCGSIVRRPSRPRCHVSSLRPVWRRQAHWPRRFCCACRRRALRLVDRKGVSRPSLLVARAMPSTAAQRRYCSSSVLCAMGLMRPARWMASTVR
jgi:hypothetical protein